jgi:hypothetical protein
MTARRDAARHPQQQRRQQRGEHGDAEQAHRQDAGEPGRAAEVPDQTQRHQRGNQIQRIEAPDAARHAGAEHRHRRYVGQPHQRRQREAGQHRDAHAGRRQRRQQRQHRRHADEHLAGERPGALREHQRQQHAEQRGRQRQPAQRAQQQREDAHARGAQCAQQRDFAGLAPRIALRRQRDGDAGKQGRQQRGQAQERVGTVEGVAHAFLRLFRGDQFAALRQARRLRPAAPALHGGRLAREQQAVPRAAADAEQAGLFGVVQVHQRARRHRDQFAAVRLLQQFAGDAQVAAAELHAVAYVAVQSHQGAMIEVDRAGRRSMAHRLPALRVGDQQRAAQRIGGIGGEHVQQLALLLREGHAGEACRAGAGQAALAAGGGELGGNRLRRGYAQVAADQFGRAGEHAAFHARGERGDHAQRHHGEHQRCGQGAQFRQAPFAAQAAQRKQQDSHVGDPSSDASRPSCSSTRRMQRSASCMSCVTSTRVVR